MKKYVLGFVHRGLCACGFGPMIWAIVYFFLNKNGIVELLDVDKVIFEIATVTILAFIAGGINIVYKIEKMPLMAAIFVHSIVLYLDYAIIYLLNGWIGSQTRSFVVFTVCFFAGYAIIWTGIYLAIRRNADHLNQKLSQMQDGERSAFREK